ncbi:MAG: thioesterase family protein [Actinomycetota bacterium]|nr:thioesterase family protein [Actinomycetota bacterium]
MKDSVAALLDLLDLDRIEDRLFEGRSESMGGAHLFGGQVIAQALVASQRCSRGDPAHSLHAYFLKRGDPSLPIRYAVTSLRASRAFDTFEVTASQEGEPILKMLASHHTPEPGPEHQIPMDDVGEPEGEAYEEALLRVMTPAGRDIGEISWELPVEIRGVGGLAMFSREVRPPNARCWMRFRSPLGDDPKIHQACFAYASDYAIAAPALHPHPVSTMDMQTASLDHAIWFHRPFRADEWMLFELDSPAAHGARTVGRGLLYDAGGHLVASCTQEAMLRPLTKPKFPGGKSPLEHE